MEIDFVIWSHGNFQFLIKNFIWKPTKLVTFQFLCDPNEKNKWMEGENGYYFGTKCNIYQKVGSSNLAN